MTEQQETILTADCGHHCGVQMVGREQKVAHCSCRECHDTRARP